MHFECIFIEEQGPIISDILKQYQKMRFIVLWYYIYINDQSYELNIIIDKDVFFFFFFFFFGFIFGEGGVVGGGVNIMHKCFKWHFYSSKNTKIQKCARLF